MLTVFRSRGLMLIHNTEMKLDLYQKGGKLDFESLPMVKMKY